MSSHDAAQTNFAVTDTGIILYTDSIGSLNAYNPQLKTVTHLLDDIPAYKLTGTLLYYMQANGDDIILKAANLNESELGDAQTIATTAGAALGTKTPNASFQLLVTKNKDIALYAGSSLYRINTNITPIANGVNQYYFDPENRSLAYTSGGELQRYDFNGNSSYLVTRTSSSIAMPLLNAAINYGFYSSTDGLHAIELDASDHQNDYVLAPLAEQPTRVALVNGNNDLLILSDGTLTLLTIR